MPKPLSLVVSFVLLMFGCICSLLGFVLELVWFFALSFWIGALG